MKTAALSSELEKIPGLRVRTGVELGLTGVPFFVIDRAIGVSGAQPSEVFERALAMAAAEGGIEEAAERG